MNTSDQLQNKLLLSKADAKALARKIKGAAYAAHCHIEQAGRWLIEFRDREGWKALGYESWTDCIEGEFNSAHGGRRRVFKLIQNAEVNGNVSDYGGNEIVNALESTKVSASEAPARGTLRQPIPLRQTEHLAKVLPPAQRAVFARAVALGHGHPTEATVKQAVEEALKAARPVKGIQRDNTGYPIPEEIMDLWNRRVEAKDILWAISRARGAVHAAIEKNDPLFFPSDVNGALANLNSAYHAMEVSVPYAVCPACQGTAREACASCKGCGFVGKLHFDTCVPEELKAIRAKSCAVL